MRLTLEPDHPITHASCVQLTVANVGEAFALSSIAGWNQTVSDWLLLMDLATACYGIGTDGRIVATATLICYGSELGWIGMVLTHPDFRRLGFARTLVRRMMEHAKGLGVRTLKLDATDDGGPLYESLGFRPEQPVERWQLAPGRAQPGTAAAASAPPFALDADAYGCDRRQLLTRLAAAGDTTVLKDGYALSRPGRINRYLGPCVATDPAVARSLIESAISRHPESGWYWDLLPANTDATAIARELGFECVRKLMRMTFGSRLRGKEEEVFAIGGFEFG